MHIQYKKIIKTVRLFLNRASELDESKNQQKKIQLYIFKKMMSFKKLKFVQISEMKWVLNIVFAFNANLVWMLFFHFYFV